MSNTLLRSISSLSKGFVRCRSLIKTITVDSSSSTMEAESHVVPATGISGKLSIREGKATLAAGVSTDKVFYNPVQEFNRDLSCLVLTVFLEKFKVVMEEKAARKASFPDNAQKPAPEPFQARILDAMAATGLRTCRYALEVPHIKEVVGNDYDASACEALRQNAIANGVQNKITVTQQDAKRLMFNAGFDHEWFHAIDLDPFGSAAPFLEGALLCVADGGLLMVTCTDTAILCGNFPEACYAKYGSTCFRNPAHHEMSLRIVLHCIAMRAGLLDKHIKPLISVREGHYVRLFLSVHRGAKEAKENIRKCSYVWNCTVCHSFYLQPMGELHKSSYVNAAISSGNICEICQTNMKIAGPIWSGPIHDQEFVGSVLTNLQQSPRNFGTVRLILGKLTMIHEELPDQPLYFVSSELFKVVHCIPIQNKQLVSALVHAGYRVSGSHCEKGSYKTNAPFDVVWDIIRCWVQQNPIALERTTYPKTVIILSKQPTVQADFTVLPEVETESRKKKLLRFPTIGVTGPMARPKPGSGNCDAQADNSRARSEKEKLRTSSPDLAHSNGDTKRPKMDVDI